ITDQPSKARMLGHDFVVFRDSAGQAHCLSDTCVHRGAALSGGKRRGDCVQCPYHGWQFDAEGRCRSIPSLGPGHKVPPRARIDAYPTVERYGLVFA
ncbi:MAG: Rieske 2Fe-2S domain-containing protein, partial [Planctomycetales bacterium]|nr:Rieske 2Fe-2S domain-containing protein [Planctomycetales bacterium]